MSILINMEMPACCETCILDHKFFKWLECYKHVTVDTINDGERSPACPLIDLPPHGRCIDVDKVLDELAHNLGIRSLDYLTPSERAIVSWFRDAPTVIPAEDSET